jgi:hypothetical protein
MGIVLSVSKEHTQGSKDMNSTATGVTGQAFQLAFWDVSRSAFMHSGFVINFDTTSITARFNDEENGIAFAARITALNFGRPCIIANGRFVLVMLSDS